MNEVVKMKEIHEIMAKWTLLMKIVLLFLVKGKPIVSCTSLAVSVTLD